MDTQIVPEGSASNPFAPSSQTEQPRQNVQSVENIAQPASEATTQEVVEYAGFWARYAASMIDGLILIVPNMIIGFLFKVPFVAMLVTWVYSIFMLNSKQATLGKMAVGLKVTSSSGENLELGKIILRETVGKLVSGMILCMGYIMVAFTKKKQGLHDMIADTVVIWDPARKKRKWVIVVGIIMGIVIPILVGVAIILGLALMMEATGYHG